MAAKLAHLVAFLVVYALFLWASVANFNRYVERYFLKGQHFLFSQFALITSYLSFFSFVYLLSGFFSWKLVALLVSTAESGVILWLVFSKFAQAPSDDYEAGNAIAGAELTMVHPNLDRLVRGASGIALALFPVLGAIILFRYEKGTPEAIRLTLQLTIVWIVLIEYPIRVLYSVWTLASESLREENRVRYLLTQVTTAMAWTPLLALLAWASGLGEESKMVELGGARLTFPPTLLTVLGGFVCLITLLPFALGTTQAKKWRLALLDLRANWARRMTDILSEPTSDAYQRKLTDLRDDIVKHVKRFVEKSPMAAFACRAEIGLSAQESALPGVPQVLAALETVRDSDPRILHLRYCSEVINKISEVDLHLSRLDKREKKKSAGAWAEISRRRREELAGEIQSVRASRSVISITIGFLIAPILTVILSEVGKRAWALLTSTP